MEPQIAPPTAGGPHQTAADPAKGACTAPPPPACHPSGFRATMAQPEPFLQFAARRAHLHRAALPRHQGGALDPPRLDLPMPRSPCASSMPRRPVPEPRLPQKDYATNVLTFDYTQDPWSAPTWCCAPGGGGGSRTRQDLQAHYAHLIVHGTLHAGLGPRNQRGRCGPWSSTNSDPGAGLSTPTLLVKTPVAP